MFQRWLRDRLPRSSFFLFGPRQVGKTTLLAGVESVLRVVAPVKAPARIGDVSILPPREALALLESWGRSERRG